MIPESELRELEERVQEALVSDDHTPLAVLGYGEISTVLGWPVEAPVYACKRLPPFADAAELAAYETVVEAYIAALEMAGIEVAETEIQALEGEDEVLVAYAVQPVLPAERLVPNLLAESDPSEGHPVVERVVELTASTVGDEIGLDAQLSNWAWLEDGRLVYLDITTPIMAAEDGTSVLDPDIFLKAYPWFLRGMLRRLVVPSLLRRYHVARTVLMDVCANLIKERLEPWLPVVMAAANRQVDPPIEEKEVRRDYRQDARTWAWMQRLRKLDRGWQRRVRRRVYPFLLPESFVR